jgi:hypothetical protein
VHVAAWQLEKNGTVPTNGPAQALVQPTVHFGGPGQFSLAKQAEFNPIRWLAERLMRGTHQHHDNSEYEEQLLQIADARRQQRLKLETKARQAKEAAARRDQQEASEKKNADTIKTISSQKQRQQERAERITALEKTRAERSGELVKNDAALAHKLATLRAQCTELIEKHDFKASVSQDASAAAADSAGDAAAALRQLEDAIQYAVVEWLCTNSVASYVAAAPLVGDTKQDLLHMVAARAIEAEVPVKSPENAEDGEEGAQEESGNDAEAPPPVKARTLIFKSPLYIVTYIVIILGH